jgi:hypothetical protein
MSDLHTANRQDDTSDPPSPKNLLPKLEAIILSHRQALIFLIVFTLNLLLVSPSLMPEFSMVNPDDEAKYVESGWRLLSGDMRDLAWGPVVALVYAPIHLVVGGSPDWFMLETWIGRIFLYSFLWWSLLYLSLQLKEHLSPYIMLGVLFVFMPFFSVVKNQSDAVFVGFSVLALAFLLKFYHHKKLKYLGIGSLMVGLGVLARVETIILLATFVILSIIIGRRNYRLYKILLSSILPAVGVIGIFFLISIAKYGNLNLGMAAKSYDSFEMNQAVLTGGDIDLARQETRRLFGTQEENQGSVLRAILRNPHAFSLRILANAKTIPENYFVFFGKKLGAVLLIFAVWGVYELGRKKAFIPLTILLIWPIHALVSLGFLSLHIVPQVNYLPLLLGAIGIAAIFGQEFHPREQFVFLISCVLVSLLSWITKKPAFFFGFSLLAVVLLLHWLVQPGWKLNHHAIYVSAFLLLAASLILREPFPYPNYPKLGKSGSEQAVHYLEKNLPTQTDVLVPTPLQAIAARMSYTTMYDIPASITTLQDFGSWLKHENVNSIYLDSNRRVRNDIYDLFEEGYSPYFSLAFNSDDNNIRIFTVK